MRKITLETPDTDEWNDWRGKCEIATQENIDAVLAGNEPTINRNLYSETKASFYMSYDHSFRGKCAYCDRDAHNQYGDIEHFRPKGRVTNLDNSVVTRDDGGMTITHPGYYWLAYSLDNLLLGCIRCNRPSSNFSDYTIGKWDKFPVVGSHAWVPGKENAEDPLLINPLIEDPADHIIFDKSGVLGWHTHKGDITVTILGLNEYSLPDRRKERYREVRSLFATYISHYKINKVAPDTLEYKQHIERILKGYGNFTRYAVMGINDEMNSIQEACQSVLH